MNPNQLSINNTEHGHQAALFAWAAMAQHHGFSIADNMDAYTATGCASAKKVGSFPVQKLEWLFAIPNGGLRDARTAAMMKAEGVRSGVADVCLPVPKFLGPTAAIIYCGLYIEMKKPKGGTQSANQAAFAHHCWTNRYIYRLCKSWREAADVIKEYLS